jgi:LuxR family quorum sensing-dependent transcriptional regulator
MVEREMRPLKLIDTSRVGHVLNTPPTLIASGRTAPSMRERHVLASAAEGKSTLEIGEILGISKATVNAHIQSAARKLGAHNRAHAVALAIHYGIIKWNRLNWVLF